jgi:hypothetical protein
MSMDAIASFFDRRAPTYDAIASHQWMARRLVGRGSCRATAPTLGT